MPEGHVWYCPRYVVTEPREPNGTVIGIQPPTNPQHIPPTPALYPQTYPDGSVGVQHVSVEEMQSVPLPHDWGVKPLQVPLLGATVIVDVTGAVVGIGLNANVGA